MSIKLTYEFDTEEQLSTFLLRGLTPAVATPVQPAATAPVAPIATPPAQPQTPVQPEVAAPVAPVAAPAAPAKASAKVPGQPVTIVQGATTNGIRAALRKVFNTKGATAATNILKEFGAVRVSDVPADKYADFLKACAA